MKLTITTLVLFTLALHLSAQTLRKPLAEKTVVKPTAEVKTVPVQQKPVVTTTPSPAPTNLQKAVVNFVTGNDGKDYDTYLTVFVNDGNKRVCAFVGNSVATKNGTQITPSGGGEYLPGNNITLPTDLQMSVPTGEVKMVGSLPVPTLREASITDFSNGGGSISVVIYPNGHDTWNINSFSVTLFFNNDPGSPHKMTWTGITMSQDSRGRDFEFDKNFNPIQ